MTCLYSNRHSVTKRVPEVTKLLKRIVTMKRYLIAVIVLWTSSYINAGAAPGRQGKNWMKHWLQGMNRYAWRLLANSSLSLIEYMRKHVGYWEASVQVQ
jgi:hypothetical protein